MARNGIADTAGVEPQYELAGADKGGEDGNEEGAGHNGDTVLEITGDSSLNGHTLLLCNVIETGDEIVACEACGGYL